MIGCLCKKTINRIPLSFFLGFAGKAWIWTDCFDFNMVTETIKALDEDSRIDAIIPFFCLDFINSFLSEQLESGLRTLIETVSKLDKAVIPVLSNYMEDDLQVEQAGHKIHALFRGAGLPVYRTIQDATAAIHEILEWNRQGSA